MFSATNQKQKKTGLVTNFLLRNQKDILSDSNKDDGNMSSFLNSPEKSQKSKKSSSTCSLSDDEEDDILNDSEEQKSQNFRM